MKNMFLVINKEKIYAYVVSVLTIVTLFFMSSIMSTDLESTEITSSNVSSNYIDTKGDNKIDNKIDNNVVINK